MTSHPRLKSKSRLTHFPGTLHTLQSVQSACKVG